MIETYLKIKPVKSILNHNFRLEISRSPEDHKDHALIAT